MFTSFSSGKTSMSGHSACWASSSTCQKRDRKQLSSCLLDLVVVHIFFKFLEKYRGRKVCKIHLCQLLHTSTCAGSGLVKLAKSSQSSHSSPWVEKEMSTICVFHLNRSIAENASQDGRGKESEDGQDQHKAVCNWDLIQHSNYLKRLVTPSLLCFNLDSVITSVIKIWNSTKKTHVHNTRPRD